MRQRLLLGISLCVLLFACVAQAGEPIPGQIMIDIKHEYLPIQVTVGPTGNPQTGLSSVDSLNAALGCVSFDKVSNYDWEPVRGMYVLGFPDTSNVLDLVGAYLQSPQVHLADPCYLRIPFGHIPTDSLYPQQWGHHPSCMNTESAWRYTSGGLGIVINVIDFGTDWMHPDQAPNVWQNLGEDVDGDGHTMEWDSIQKAWILDPGDINDWDDDGNNLRDDLVGWDFWNYNNPPGYKGDNDPRPVPSDDHGDHTAGTIAAVTNNELSDDEAYEVCDNMRGTVAGTSWFSRIMITRFSGSEPTAIAAIEYGVMNGANIISMSWGGTEPHSELEQAIVGAYSEGVLLVAAAGNYIYDVPAYPAAYSCVIAVAATDINDVKEDYSNYGYWVDLCAPGDNYSPGREWKWERLCFSELGGTSIAAPFIAGVAALVWTCNLSATNDEVRYALESTADDICSLPGNQGQPWCSPFNKLGHGRVNALEAVKVFRPYPPPPGDCLVNYRVDLGDALCILNWLNKNQAPPDPFCAANVNGDDTVDIADALYILNYLFHGGPAPQDGCI
jgi:subtilisin family serine protease